MNLERLQYKKDVLVAHDRGTCECDRTLTSIKDITRQVTTIFQTNYFRQYAEQMFVHPYFFLILLGLRKNFQNERKD
jgi:hypothetical protein